MASVERILLVEVELEPGLVDQDAGFAEIVSERSPSGATAPEMVSLSGIMTGPGFSPKPIEANQTRTNSSEG